MLDKRQLNDLADIQRRYDSFNDPYRGGYFFSLQDIKQLLNMIETLRKENDRVEEING